MVRLAVARLHFCSNSFNPERTGLDDMQAHEWGAGAETLAGASPGSELAGLAAFLAERPDWQAWVLRAASAPPGGPLQAGVFGTWLADVEAGLAEGRFDAVYLSLHGACQAEGDPTVDLTILRRVRAVVGRMPVVASFHAAANLSEEAALLLDAACGAGPVSGGGDAAARRTLTLLEGLLAGRTRPVGVLVRVPSLVASLGAPAVLPDIWAQEVAAPRPGVLDCSVFSGFPWSDCRSTGASALVWTDRDSGLGRSVAQHLARQLAAVPRPPAPWAPAAAIAAARAGGVRSVLLDTADDPAAGGLADTPGLLAALVAAELPRPAAFGVLHDPAAVAAARAAGPGGTVERALGGRLTADYGPPVPLRLTVERLAGSLAVLRHGLLAILVAEARPAGIGLATLGEAGIAPDDLALAALKTGATSDLAAAFPEVLACACPGPASTDLLGLPFQYVLPARRGG